MDVRLCNAITCFSGENTEELKDFLREGPDYALLPEEAWNYLINWYGLSLHSKPIMRPVVEAGTSPFRFLMVEVYRSR
ncbi:PREDICTED: ubiquitin carboxyl-terminal hydrolase 11-like [Amphimedon queenslandica]|uniref:DUSP domain-containing protein n=1 Tax=Amphimedon queenslandica TaxID=400682 RepID=A0A1X7TA86_AMPQE|nr:PREDICTED: ubiquitin carboxyl-terminal hydrolase 11-like [Amphimedon queenslandica]|eukprot:XP_019860639.1 PREDICTED: ubiquitin carboxyl-terminal hydrolase 11-like [Amphimedon queenslandica]